MTGIFVLSLSIKGRINYYQLERYGQFSEQRYRQQFEKPFDFMELNTELAFSYGSGRFAIAFDPSYISKSGKHTPGLGRYWSGCAHSSKWGLEISGIAAIDVDKVLSMDMQLVSRLRDDADLKLS